jgi:hypothetical protein
MNLFLVYLKKYKAKFFLRYGIAQRFFNSHNINYQ